jgi:hypothetical protein
LNRHIVARPPSPDALAIDPLHGEFAYRRTETAYLERQRPRTRAQFGFTLLFCTVFFLGFFVTDVAALGLVPDTAILLAARLVVALTGWRCAGRCRPGPFAWRPASPKAWRWPASW